MTFIASVVAKKGVAVIADSLVTSQLPILHYRTFLKHLHEKPKDEHGQISLDPNEISSLFAYEPIYTKDFEEKLFKLNDYTAITTTGVAIINDKKIEDIVREFIGVQHDIDDFAIPIETKVNQFKDFVVTQIREHLGKYEQIGVCIFIITYYERSTHTTHIYRLVTQETDNSSINLPDFEFISVAKEMDWIKVVCDGQNKLSENILYGIGKTLYNTFPAMVNKIIEHLKLPEGTVPEGLINELIQDPFFKDIFFNDIELLNLSNLSVQQAVDLASLLMRLEVDFQRYTKDIPTVGGVIKLAKIDEDGFRFISGHNIEKPKHIQL